MERAVLSYYQEIACGIGICIHISDLIYLLASTLVLRVTV